MVSIGVVMITHEGGRWVRSQAHSIATQTRLPDEVVIADDGSTDDSVAHALSALEPIGQRCRVLRSAARLGVTANLERAIRHAESDVIVLADQDDVWLPHKLVVVEHWADTSPSGGMFSDGWIVDARGDRTGERLWRRAGLSRSRAATLSSDPLAILLRQPVVTGATMAVRRGALDVLLPIPRHGWHDYAMSLLLAATSGLFPVTDALVEYRLHGANTAGLPSKSRRDRVVGAEAHRENLRTQIALFEALVERMEAQGDRATAARFSGKLDVLRRRAALPAARPMRLPGVARLIVGGGYRRYAQGYASAARDLLWP
jgi:glycosyltransferase involved in cell wall biosynthesis